MNNSIFYSAYIHYFFQVANFNSKNVANNTNTGNIGPVKHYTQMVFGPTTKIGCGYISFMDKKQPAEKQFTRVGLQSFFNEKYKLNLTERNLRTKKKQSE